MAEDDVDEPLTAPSEPKERAKPIARSEELCHEDDLVGALTDLYADIEKGFGEANERTNEQIDYWKLYNCELCEKQAYDGNSKIYVPLVHDAVNARATRFTNQIFPSNQRYVEVITDGPDKPFALEALLDDYVRRAKLRTVVVPAMMRCGDIEGQYNLYAGWLETERSIAFKQSNPVEVDGEQFDDPDMNIESVEEETVKIGRPYAEVISDQDVCVLPATADSVDEALFECGGSVTIIRRWSKSLIEQKIADKKIDKENGEALVKELSDQPSDAQKRQDVQKKSIVAAGIQSDGRGFHAIIYETWTVLRLRDGHRRLCRVYYAGSDGTQILSCKRNPYWNDKCPLLSVPLRKIHGSFKGRAPVATSETLQYQANDAVNMGMDSATYSMLPIIMTDPEKNPRIGSMVLSLAAIWETSPKDTQFAEFPQLWKEAMEIVSACEGKIQQNLSVNSAMIPQQNASNNLTQAEVAAEQQVDMLTTADAVTVIEEGILTPLMQRWIEYDHQFRDKEITVRQYGALGIEAGMEPIEPLQWDAHYQFRWFGVEQAKNAQAVQQQIAALNVLRGIPPQMYQGWKLDVAPVIQQLVENTFGPRLAPQVFKSMKSELAMQPDIENQVLMGGMWMPIHMMDDHQAHIMSHSQLMQQNGDPTGAIREHIMQHQQAMQAQVMAQQQAGAPMPGGQPGAPGGAGPGVSGTPRMGGQPDQQRPAQGPPGMIPQDSMVDPSRMPRPQRG